MTRIQEIETRRRREQERLDQEKSPGERNELGQFATPPALALDIAQYAWNLWQDRAERVRFLDPGIGTGAFYSALRQTFPARRITCASGVEVDPAVAQAAKTLWRGTGSKVITGDFTKQAPPAPRDRYNLVLTNPPYVRHHHLGRDEKLRLQKVVARDLGIKVSGLAGLYCYFLFLAHRWLAERGLAIWLIPSEFMDVNYGTAVKEYLTRHVRLLHIHRFCPSDVQFADALVTSTVVVFENSPPLADREVEFSFGGSLVSPSATERVPLALLRQDKRKWSHYPLGAGNGTLTGKQALTIADLFIVKRGIATGANAFFVLPKKAALERGIPTEFLRPILPSPRYLKESVIEAGPDGYPMIDEQLALIECSHPEAYVRENYHSFWSYLQHGKKLGVHERYLTRGRAPWYSQEQRQPAPFLCTYMGRNRARPFRLFWNKSRATAANVYLLLYPREPLRKALEANPDLGGAVFERLQNLTPENFLGEGRVYGGGLYKMEPKELGRLSAESLRDLVGVVEPKAQREIQFA